MTFNDIFRSSFLENFLTVSLIDAFISLFFAFLLGWFIYRIYRHTFSGVMYSQPFNTSLMLLTMLTTFIILAVTSNVVLSLGMVGALSIVRFRTAIKDPLDLVFLFWAIGGGIVLGAGMISLALIGSLIIGTILWIMGKIKSTDTSYILMLDCDSERCEMKCNDVIEKKTGKYRLKSKTIEQQSIELIYEVHFRNQSSGLVNEIAAIDGVRHVQMVSYNGEYAA